MEENINVTEEIGSVRIASDVITVIASMAASEVKGVASLGGKDFTEKLGVKSSTKGVKVQVGEDDATIDIHLVIEYGEKILDVASKVQSNVKKSVETMSGLSVACVNVHVQGITMPKEDKDK
ncbi:MAG: Asp23/Gls24 family envelope stress response protein [Clostridium sp.]|uniref:Asp23/Gls24 family envelope stress response protein n=1 Tax=Clostridium sp. TaxID=1506 RepID=UPI002FC92686